LRVGGSLRVPGHDLRRGLAADLAQLIFDFAAAGAERAIERNIEVAQIRAESVESAGDRFLRAGETIAQTLRHQLSGHGAWSA